MGHTGATDSLHKSLFDDTVLDIQGKLAGTLLRSTPADTVGQAGDVLDLFCVHPLPFLRDRGVGVIGAFSNAAHLLHFFSVNHI